MRLLYVLDSLSAGGAEQSLAAMCAPLLEKGVELTIATLSPGGQHVEQVRASGAALVEFDVAGIRRRAQAISGLITTTTPDIVHTTLYDSDLAGRLAARRTGTPVSSTLTTTRYVEGWAPTLPWWKAVPVRTTEMASSRICPRLHAVSWVVADTMAEQLKYPRNRIDVVHRGRDPEVLGRRTLKRRTRLRGELGIHEGRPLVLAVGRHEYVKGHDTTIRAFAASRIRERGGAVVIAGREGRDTDELVQLVAELGINDQVTFLGHRTDVADLMCAADVLASGSRREGLPGTLIEGLALEVPIVATDLPQVTEVLSDLGNLVPVSDVKAMANSLTETLDLPSSAVESMTTRGRQRFEDHFTLDAAVDGLLDHWNKVLST